MTIIKDFLLKLLFLFSIIAFQAGATDYEEIRGVLNRELSNCSISNQAKELGVNRSTLANFLSGEKKTSPTIYNAIQIHRPYLIDRLDHASQFVMKILNNFLWSLSYLVPFIKFCGNQFGNVKQQINL